ncbi:MAG: PAS domain S-box protein [Melioribacteraceae bacterium]|nr:PAS domain S-box protein [Melioribacteraceae bacterium]
MVSKNKKIFVVEDENIVALEIHDRLLDLGYQVCGTASSGEVALVKINEALPDLVLMDIMLKGELDGIQTARILKETNDVPVVFLTAYTDENTLQRVKLTEPFGYIIKPFQEKELLISIEMAMHKYESQKRIREKDEWLSTVLNSIGDAVIATDTNGKVSFMNPVAEKLTGYSMRETIGKDLTSFFRIVNEISGDAAENPVSKILRDGNKIGLANHTALIAKDGTVRPIMDSAAPIKDEKGNILGVVLVFQDMTHKKNVEDIIKENEKRYRTLVENSPEIIYTYSLKNGAIYFSPRLYSVLGYKLDQVYSNREFWISLIHPNDLPNYELALKNAAENRSTSVDYRLKDINHRWRWFNDRLTLIEKQGDDFIYQGLSSETTEKKYAEEQINLQKSAMDSAYNGILISDKKGKIIWCNKAVSRISGYDHSELIGANTNLFKSGAHNDDFYLNLWRTILFGEVWFGEIQNKRKNGEIYYEEMSITPVQNNDGEISHYICIKHDITERKNFENLTIRAKEEAEKSNKLKSEFLAQMSHEIRTPVNSILSFSNLLKSELKGKIDDELSISFDMMDLGGKRLIRTIDLILNMSSVQTNSYQAQFKNINLIEEIIKPVIQEFEVSAKVKGLKLNFKNNTADDYLLKIDEYSVTQIFVNLIDNAIKYTGNGSVNVYTGINEKGEISVTVEDSGIGISDEYLPQLFEPFSQEDKGYTRRFEGTGLGLALVRNYCEINNATIDVKSSKGSGSKFTVTFN